MIFVDTGAWFAAFVPNDADHAMADAWLETNTDLLVTTDYVIDELLTLMKMRVEGHFHSASAIRGQFSSLHSTGSCTCPLRINTAGSPGCLLQEQKGLDEGARMASQRPSHPCGRPRRRPCGRTSPAQATSPCRFPPPCLLTPLLAGAMAARGTAAPHAASTHDRSVRLPLLGYRAATAWSSRSRWWARAVAGAGVRSRGASRNCSSSGTRPTAAATHLRPCTAC